MSDWSVNRIGSINGAADKTALFLKVFGGEVLTAFSQYNVFMPLHTVRTISSGKTAQFPVTGVIAAHYHTPGAELVGQSVNNAEKTISIDNLLVSDFSLYNLDEAMSHFEVRSEYSKQTGIALANQADKYLAVVAYLTARSAATITGQPGGSSVISSTAGTDSDALLSAISSAAEKLDENLVPEGDRHTALAPAQWWLLANSTKVFNRDYGNDGVNGSLARPAIMEWANILIHKSNTLRVVNGQTLAADATNEKNTYNGAFTNSIAPVFHRSAFGTVKLLDLSLETEYSVSRQSTLVVSKYAMGHGVLRPECAVEIKTA
jgi:hypothetical protein